MLTTLPLQFDAVFSAPGLLGALVLAAVVILVGRVVLRVAWKVVVAATVVVAALWVLGLLGPTRALLGL